MALIMEDDFDNFGLSPTIETSIDWIEYLYMGTKRNRTLGYQFLDNQK